MKQLKKTLLTLVALLAVTTGAWAASVSYVDGNGTSQNVDATELESTTTSWTDGSWYIVPEGGLTISGRIAVSGTVNLILRDGTELTASAGITTTNATLNIYAQSTGTGALTATGANGATNTGGNAGIGGIGVGYNVSGGAGGTVNIYGGTVTATGGNGGQDAGGGAGIGGGGLGFLSKEGGAGGTVNIYGGTVTATGGNGGQDTGGGAGIGGGGLGFQSKEGSGAGGTVNIYGGTVTSTGGTGEGDGGVGAGIGGGGNGFGNSAGAGGTLTLGVGAKLYNGTDNSGTVLDDNDSESRNYSGSRPQNMFAEGTVVPSASSGPEVAWDKAEKTGTFTMPGGNVTLEPEYYPQAALAAAPTAINDVPATTDGAIVKAGTVKNIGETTNAQGTVMYYVSPTALDDAALLALAADAWKADVPTAESLAQGQAYVYYYVRGNDSDNDEENFSDGDILAANKVAVTIAAEPTYAVTFAEGVNPEPPAEPEWTASPAADVKKGQTVTVTYSGSKKVIGVKAEKKAAAGIVNPVVGQIIGSDGKNYDANATLPSGVTAVAKIAYVGNDAETSTTYNHGLALALGDVSDKKAWCSQYQKTCLTTQYGSADAAKGDMAGIANTDALVNHTGHSHAAASAARDYNGGTHPMGTSEWFLPSAGQWDKMASAAGGYVKLRTNAGLQSDYYWSSTERDASYAWYFSSHNGDWLKDYKDMYSHRVRACLAF